MDFNRWTLSSPEEQTLALKKMTRIELVNLVFDIEADSRKAYACGIRLTNSITDDACNWHVLMTYLVLPSQKRRLKRLVAAARKKYGFRPESAE